MVFNMWIRRQEKEKMKIQKERGEETKRFKDLFYCVENYGESYSHVELNWHLMDID